jgi:hypothetical protein
MALWPMILKQAPALLAAADELLARSRRRSTASTVADDAHALRQRIAELEQQQQANADLVRQLTNQINALTVAAEGTAEKASRALILAGVGVGLGIVASLVAWLR